MDAMQRQRLNDYMRSLDFRQRVAKQCVKVLLLCGAIALVLGWWWSLVSCSLMQPVQQLDDLGDDSGDPVWPQGCAKDSEIPKLTDDEPTDPAFWKQTIHPL